MEWTEIDRMPELGPAPMQQHGHYGRACAALGSRVLCLAAGPRSHPFGAVQILIRRWPLFGDFALVARGPVWAPDVSDGLAHDGLESLLRHLRHRFRGVIVTPEAPTGCDPLDRDGRLILMTPGTMARLDLSGTPAERRARQHVKWRNRLRASERSDLVTGHRSMPKDAAHWLLAFEAAQARARRYRRLPHEYAVAWRDRNGAGSTRLFWAEAEGLPAAGMLFLLHGSTATYHIGWTGEAGRKRHAHARLLWEASEWLADRGIRWIDIGTLDTVDTPGLARFKLGSGAVPLPLGATRLDAPGARQVAMLFGGGRGMVRATGTQHHGAWPPGFTDQHSSGQP